ncbi:efflux RND transporter periplasmic adaptor subunit [Cupriavidus sp. 30B13]|uniref:efflux RND transporter periplasmic adaptor subunit n=1 Tax=Cupriavidus sp. 30B13 TaxID=3384241 RepID=UPI003B8FFC68
MANAKRFLPLTAALLAVTAICGTVWWISGGKPAYDTVALARGNVETSVTALGTLQPRSYVDVGAQVSGQITQLLVQVGDTVKQGQLLAEIDASVPRATVEAGRAELAGLKAQLAEQQALFELARQQDTRQRHLAGNDATREEDVQTAAAALKTAAARMDRLRAQIEQTQSTLNGDVAKLGYTRIYAPMAGTVVTLEARLGQTLNATYQTPNLLRIADLNAMTVWTEVSEADVRRVLTGMPVSFNTLGSSQRRWRSKVRQVLPAPPAPAGQAQQAQGNQPAAPASKVVLYTVLFDVDNADGELMPQMTAQVSFVAAQASDTLVAPLAALQAIDGKPDRFRARVLDGNGRAQSREVRVGVRDRLRGQVLEGLREGELLITGERKPADDMPRIRL